MSPPPHGLTFLIDPLPLREFFAAYWERRPLLVQRQDDAYYSDLLTNSDLDTIISSSDARYPAIRLAKNGTFYPAAAYTKDVTVGNLTFQGVPDLDKISAEYSKGATISLPLLYRTWEPLRALCVQLEEELDHSVHANAYITPGQTAGFPPHYDTHDVLVLQLTGSKRWFIDTPTIVLPHATQTFRPQGFVPGPRLMEIELSAGDLLYLPRGYVHSTKTSDRYSAHVTIGINIYTWADLVRDLDPGAVEREDLRRAMPVGFASRAELRPAMKAELARILGTRSPVVNFDSLIDLFIRRVKLMKERPPPRFRSDVIVISVDSLLRAPPAQAYRIAQQEDSVRLEFGARQYIFPATIAPTLNAMCMHSTFRIKDLPPTLDTGVALDFARYMQGIGFLRSAGSV